MTHGFCFPSQNLDLHVFVASSASFHLPGKVWDDYDYAPWRYQYVFHPLDTENECENRYDIYIYLNARHPVP